MFPNHGNPSAGPTVERGPLGAYLQFAGSLVGVLVLGFALLERASTGGASVAGTAWETVPPTVRITDRLGNVLWGRAVAATVRPDLFVTPTRPPVYARLADWLLGLLTWTPVTALLVGGLLVAILTRWVGGN